MFCIKEPPKQGQQIADTVRVLLWILCFWLCFALDFVFVWLCFAVDFVLVWLCFAVDVVFWLCFALDFVLNPGRVLPRCEWVAGEAG